MDKPGRARPVVKVIDILGDKQQFARPLPVKPRQGMVRGARLHARKRSPAHVVECLHQVRIAREGLWRADVFHTVTLQQPVRPEESRLAGFGGTSGTSEEHTTALPSLISISSA